MTWMKISLRNKNPMKKVSSNMKMRSLMKMKRRHKTPKRKNSMEIYSRWKTRMRMSMMMKTNTKINLLSSRTSMDQKLKSLSEITKKLSTKKVKIETQSSIFPQVLVRPVLLLLPCITISLILKRKRLSFLLTLFSWSNSKLKQSKGHFMESFRINLFVNNSTKTTEVMKFISTGLGTEFAERLFVFMGKKIRILAKLKRKRFKAVLCLKGSSSENFKILQWSLSFLKCFLTVSEEGSLNLLIFHLLCLMSVIIAKVIIHTQELWINSTLILRKSLKRTKSWTKT